MQTVLIVVGCLGLYLVGMFVSGFVFYSGVMADHQKNPFSPTQLDDAISLYACLSLFWPVVVPFMVVFAILVAPIRLARKLAGLRYSDGNYSCSETSVSEQLPLKTAKRGAFCGTCSATNRVAEQVH